MKKRILSFLLALLMVVSIFPAPAHATDSTDVTITPTETPVEAVTETPCPTCGTIGCTSEHLNWCADCKVDDCGKTHVFCETCQKNDCGVDHNAPQSCGTCGSIECDGTHDNWCADCKVDNCGKIHVFCETCQKNDCGVDHNATEPTEDPANEIAVIDDSESTSPFHANIGRKAQFDLTYSQFPIVTDPTGVTAGDVFGMDIAVSKDVIPADLIVKIVDCYVNEAEDIYWYKIEAAEGYTLPAEFSSPAWVFQDNVSTSYGSSLILMEEEQEDKCPICGETDCGSNHENWCEICQKDDCGIDHTPSISATVNGQTVTVSGEALPEGATLTVTAMEPVLTADGYKKTRDYNISLWLDGEKYEPTSKVKVTFTGLDVYDYSFVKLVHYMEDPDAIAAGQEAGTVLVYNDAELAAAYPVAAAAAYEVLGESNTVCVELFYSTEGQVEVSEGAVSFYATSFSIYTMTTTGTDSETGRIYAVYDDDNGTAQNSNGYSATHEITMDDSNNATFMLTRGQKFYLDIGSTFFVTGMTSYQWYLSSSSLGSLDTSGFGTLAGNDTILTVAKDAPHYTKYTIRVVGYNLLGANKNERTINVYVVPEVQLYFNANIPESVTSSSITVPTSRKTVLGDGTSTVPYTRVQVSNPTGTIAGYTFNGWYTEATGGTKVSSGSYVFLDNDNAEYIGGTYSDQYRQNLYAQWDPIEYTVKFNANGGIGTMNNQAMTYDEPVALYKNEFERDGHVFLGWAKSANATVPDYTDGQSVSNLTTTNGATVTLYAVWVDVMAIRDMRIGINESYYFTNFKYEVTADGVSTSSYHAYPNEPAVQAIRYMRATDSDGYWHIVQNEALANPAGTYIDSSILRSEFFVHSYMADQNVWGISDPSGGRTREFIKIGSADQQVIIDAWLQSMADRTADTPNEDGTYNIDSWGTPYKTDVNWNNEVGKSADYEIIPYVIKLENNASWRIDMVIAPKSNVTLSYDLNINTDTGYTLTGGSSIPSTQHPRNSEQNVLLSPTEYNQNIKVTKPGTGYVAKFLYWEDDQGYKYGAGYDTTIVMDSSKSLKAVWEYTDQTQGSLRVEKDVIVPAGSGLTPSNTQAFTLRVNFGTSGSYPYTRYSSGGIASGTGAVSGTTASFSLKDNEYVIITGIGKGVSYTVTETAVAGYTNKTGTISGTVQAGNTMSATIINERNAYTVTWKNWDGTDLEVDPYVEYNTVPTYNGKTPERPATETSTYAFKGWDKTVVAATGDITYTATYTETKRKYTVTFVDDDGTVLKAATQYDYGTAASAIVKPADPTKEATAEFTYTFDGWTPEVVAVTGDATYQATFTETKRSYTITWLNDDDSVIDTTSVAYGEVPSHADPSKAATAEYTYTFSGWTPEVVAVTGEATYKATYTAEKHKYTVTWKNEDGTVLETDTGVEYGATPSYDGAEPTKAPENQYTYTFRAWSPEIVPVTGDAVYIASFDPHENFYTVTWVNHDGTVLETDENVAWDTMPEYDGDTPEKAGNAEHSYSFAGWSPTVSKVNGHATYTATFAESVNTYTVTWKNEDSTVLETDEDVVYGAMPNYDGETPEKTATAQYTYTFDGWDKEVVAVTGDATYTAKFSATVNKYTVTFVDEDGTTILKEATEYEYGTAAENIVKPADPTKKATAEHTYTFAGWTPEITDVAGNVTYTATYTIEKNQYTLSGEIDHGTVTGPVTVEYGQEASITFTPAEGYKFHAWQVNDGETTEITTPAATWTYKAPELKENTSVVITMTPIEYTITYYLNEGALGEGITNPETYTIETGTFTLNNPTRAGYKFKGWAISADATTGDETVTIEKGTTGNLTYYAVWERSLVDLTIKATTADTNQNFIFTVSGTRSDGVVFAPIDVVLCSDNNFKVTIKDLPVGEYTVTEKDGWSWREKTVDSKQVSLTTESKEVAFAFGAVDRIYWLNDYSYKRKKGGS